MDPSRPTIHEWHGTIVPSVREGRSCLHRREGRAYVRCRSMANLTVILLDSRITDQRK